MEQKEINPQLLDKLKKIKEQYDELTFLLGDIKMQKLLIKEKEDFIIGEFEIVRTEEKEILTKLRDTYGEGAINLEKGIYVVNKKTEQ